MEQTQYKIGDTIKIVYMNDDIFGRNYAGRTGVIERIDDLGRLHGTWGGVVVLPKEDKIELVKEITK